MSFFLLALLHNLCVTPEGTHFISLRVAFNLIQGERIRAPQE